MILRALARFDRQSRDQPSRVPQFACLALACLATALPAQSKSSTTPPGRADDRARVLELAGDNAKEIAKALDTAPAAQRAAMLYLVRHMPKEDLRSLRANDLLENVRLAFAARAKVPWGKRIPEAVFLDSVVPYAHVDEDRRLWRKEAFDRFLPMIAGCKSPGEAAQVLNRKVFSTLEVRYSTKRRAANQCAKETMESGLASCTGLSILLADACRACAVPARLAGVASWRKKRGNHTWVEVWDQGWHFTGACEPSKKGLNHTWFLADVAHAEKGSRRYGVWAVTWKRDGAEFPLAWSRGRSAVGAVEVTERYVPSDKPAKAAFRLLVRVLDAKSGRETRRVKAGVRLVRLEDGRILRGTSRDESADTNDLLSFSLEEPGGSWRVYAERGTQRAARTWRLAPSKAGNDRARGQSSTLDLVLSAAEDAAALTDESAKPVLDYAATAFVALSKGRKLEPAPAELSALLATPEGDATVRRLVARAFREAPVHGELADDYAKGRVRSGKHTSPYTIEEVGAKPNRGWPLIIAMHGGGGTTQRVNDRQWQHMQRYYRKHPKAGGHLYVALRAPNNRWNGFYDSYVYPLIERLIRQLIVCADVDPDRVSVIGYSHGGYGAFAIAPKIPHRFASAHASAAAPTDGLTSARTLAHLPFTFMIGARDKAYGRAKRCQAFAETLRGLQSHNAGLWPCTMQWQARHGHGGLPDRDHVLRLLPHRRHAAPKQVDWAMTGSDVDRHYWLYCAKPIGGQSLRARLNANVLQLDAAKENKLSSCSIGLDARLVDYSRPLIVERNGQRREFAIAPRLDKLVSATYRLGDAWLAATCEVELELD